MSVPVYKPRSGMISQVGDAARSGDVQLVENGSAERFPQRAEAVNRGDRQVGQVALIDGVAGVLKNHAKSSLSAGATSD